MRTDFGTAIDKPFNMIVTNVRVPEDHATDLPISGAIVIYFTWLVMQPFENVFENTKLMSCS
jgi:hypothetical protein